MRKKISTILSSFIGLLFVGCFQLTGKPSEDLPNIIFFLMDDMGIGDLVTYYPGSKLSLPNLEQLAADGMIFKDAHSPTGVCAPTRYSIMTGNYPWRGRHEWGTWAFNRPSQVLPGQETLANLLSRAGYRSAFLGKLHLGGEVFDKETGRPIREVNPDFTRIDWSRPIKSGPIDLGFDYSYMIPNGIQARPHAFFKNDILASDPDNLIFWEVGQYGRSIIQTAGFGDADWDSSEAGPRLTASALNFIDRHFESNQEEGSNRPFFLYYSSQSCHTPHTPPAELMGVPIDGASNLSAHLDLIIEADVTLGILKSKLKEHGVLENTLIIFSSDNGGLAWGETRRLGHNSSGPLRGGKGSVYEGGHRVPLLIRLGDGTPEGSIVPPGTVSHALVGLNDLFATFAELTGQKVPEGQAVDSVSFWGHLQGDETAPTRRNLLVQSNTDDHEGQQHKRMWRDGPWKLIVDRNWRAFELYNLDEDLAEQNNLLNDPAHAERVQRMEREVRELRGL